MKKENRIILKIIIIIVVTAAFLFLIQRDTKRLSVTQPEGEGITAEEVFILANALLESSSADIHRQPGGFDETAFGALAGKYEGNQNSSFAYEDYIELLRIFLGEQKPEEVSRELTFAEEYREGFYLLKKDWYRAFEKLLQQYQAEEEISRETIAVLHTYEEEIQGEEAHEKAAVRKLIDKEGTEYSCLSEKLAEADFSVITAYRRGKELLTLVEGKKDSFSLANVWVMEADESGLTFFYQGHEIYYPWRSVKEGEKAERENIADLSFAEGGLEEIQCKKERISGKLLRLDEKELELEGKGVYEIAEDCKGYQLYEQLKEIGIQEMAIGYDFADFILDQGKICGMLAVRREHMETIRVAIKDSGFSSLYHETIRLSCDTDMEIQYGKYGERISEIIPAGETLVFQKGCRYTKHDRAEVTPLAKTGKIQVDSLQRSQGIPAYRGSMEIVEGKEGLLFINEVLLEEYLYSVVPSEMPATYPEEALMSQAVCARTYAYRYLTSPGLGALGANVDDSVSYQVYNNIAENINSTKAVKETTGQLLFYEGEPVSTYYYSTSCGFGTDAGIWKEDNREAFPYLRAVNIGEENKSPKMTEEEFEAYLLKGNEKDYEKEVSWYRWEYESGELNTAKLSERLLQRYEADKSKVLTWQGEDEDYSKADSFLPVPPEKIKKIYEIRVLSRREGGVAHELLLHTDKGIYKIISEYNIRYLLNNGGEVIRQDGTGVESTTLLPSAYLIIDTVKKKENVIGYTIFGGGYGHGVGMSQNGAGKMADRGMTCEEILTFFYKDCEIEKVY